MKFTIPKDVLFHTLKLLAGAADKRGLQQVLLCVNLKVKGEVLEASTTDLIVGLTMKLPVKNTVAGEAMVQIKTFIETISKFPSADVTLEVKDGKIDIKSGKARSTLYCFEPGRGMVFPAMPTHKGKWAELDPKVLLDVIGQTMFATSNDETRFHLMGVHFRPLADGTIVESTDGHRAVQMKSALTGLEKCILPKRGLEHIVRLVGSIDGEWQVGFGQERLFLISGDETTQFSVKVIDAEFPPMDQVVPPAADAERVVTFERDTFLGVLDRVAVLASPNSGVILAFDKNLLHLKAEHAERGNAEDEMAVEYSGPKFRVAFGPVLLREAVEHFKEKVELHLSPTPLDPFRFTNVDDASYVNVLMPLRE